MMTVRQIERLWGSKGYAKLLDELLSARPEGELASRFKSSPAIAAAAMAMIRLDELDQAHVSLYGDLLRLVLARQDADGGWGEPVLTALCVRALSGGRGEGIAIERGLKYLASLQQDAGIWPGGPLRRMPADAYASAAILSQLGDHSGFREAVRVADAMRWFETHESSFDTATRALWSRARLRCRMHALRASRQLAVSWS